MTFFACKIYLKCDHSFIDMSFKCVLGKSMSKHVGFTVDAHSILGLIVYSGEIRTVPKSHEKTNQTPTSSCSDLKEISNSHFNCSSLFQFSLSWSEVTCGFFRRKLVFS